MKLKELNGQNIFDIAYNMNLYDNGKVLRFSADGDVVELKLIGAIWYGEPREESTYALLCMPYDEKEVDVVKVVGFSDGSSGIDLDVPDDIRYKAFEDMKKLNRPDEVSKGGKTGRKQSRGQKPSSFPGLAWYESKGMPIEEIPIDKKTLRKLGEDQTFIAVTTYPLLKRNMFIILGLFLAAAVIVGIMFAINGQNGIIALMIAFFGGSFIVQKFSGVIDGFNELSGTWRIKMPIGYHILYRLIAPIAMLWGAISLMIYKLLGKNERFRMLMLPRVGIPRGCGLDNVIDVYRMYEASVDEIDARTVAAEQNEKKRRELAEKTKSVTQQAKKEITELKGEMNTSDHPYKTYAEIKELESKIDQVNSAQKDYDRSVKEKNERLEKEAEEIDRICKNEIDSL